jgi:hypothetical protein
MDNRHWVTGMPSSPTPTQVPMPPSTSQFLNQNDFPSSNVSPLVSCHSLPPLPTQNFCPHTFHQFQHTQNHYPSFPDAYMNHDISPYLSHPVFPPQHECVHSPLYQSHSTHQSQPVYPSTTPTLHPNSVPGPLSYADTFTVLHSNTSVTSLPKSLPSVSHIPLLTGWADFGIWNEGIQALILHLGYFGHIVSQSTSGWCGSASITYTATYLNTFNITKLAASNAW